MDEKKRKRKEKGNMRVCKEKSSLPLFRVSFL
jgi:hypothetical protein